MTRFTVGQTVRALDSVQGLTRAARYAVVKVDELRTFAGNFVTYWVRDAEVLDARPTPVGNGHLILTEDA